MLYCKRLCERYDGTNICRNRGKRRFFRLESRAGFMVDRELALSYWNYFMILILVPNTRPDSAEYKQLMAHLANSWEYRHVFILKQVSNKRWQKSTWLVINKVFSAEEVSSLLCVDRMVRIFEGNRVFGRHKSTRYRTGALWLLIDGPQSSSVKNNSAKF